jgi:hypothetical protein
LDLEPEFGISTNTCIAPYTLAKKPTFATNSDIELFLLLTFFLNCSKSLSGALSILSLNIYELYISGIASQKLNSPIELIMARADGTFNYYYSYFVVTWVVTIPTKVYYWTGNESVKVNSIKCWSGVAWDEVVAVWAWVESVWEQVWGA